MESRKRRWDNSQPVMAPSSNKRGAGDAGPQLDGGGTWQQYAPRGDPSDRHQGHGEREYTVPLKSEGGAGGSHNSGNNNGNGGGGSWQQQPRPQDPSRGGSRGRWDNSIASDFEAAMGGYNAAGMYPPPPAVFPGMPPAGMPPPVFERPPAFPPPPPAGGPSRSMPPPAPEFSGADPTDPTASGGVGGGSAGVVGAPARGGAADPAPQRATSGSDVDQGGGGGPDAAPPAPPSRPNNRSSTSTPPPDRADYEYTRSLHWDSSAAPEKRPVDLPGDVEHITDVEWADETSSTHESSAGDGGGTCAAAAGGRSSLQSSLASLAKACKPRMVRPEPCFCEPDLDTQETCCNNTDCALFASQEECPTGCPCGPLCGNKRIQRRQWKRLSVFDAGLKGRGLMVNEDCERGDFVVEYTGVAVQKKFLDSLFRKYKSERMLYIMALDNNVYIDARFRGGIARYINHRCGGGGGR